MKESYNCKTPKGVVDQLTNGPHRLTFWTLLKDKTWIVDQHCISSQNTLG